MSDIMALTEATIRKKSTFDESVGWPLAAIKTIEAQGITFRPDVIRLKKEILAELRTRGVYRPMRSVRHYRRVRWVRKSPLSSSQ